MAAPADASSIPDLVQRLRGGRRAEQLRAAQQLYDMALPFSESVRTAIAAAGAIPALVPLMNSSSSALRAAVCGTLSYVIVSPGGQDAFMAAGGLPPLLDCLFRCSDIDVQYQAANVATNLLLAINPRYAECHAAIAAGIPTLVSRLGSERPVPGATAGLLHNLFVGSTAGTSLTSRAAEAAVAAGAVAALARLLTSGDDYEQEQALSVLANLSGDDNAAADAAIFAEGLIPTFVERLSSQHQRMQFSAAMAVANLTLDPTTNCDTHLETLAAAGAVPHLVNCLASGDEEAQLRAAWALEALCRGSPQRCRAAEAAGAVAALQRTQQASNEDVQQAASDVLAMLRSATAAAVPPSTSTPASAASQPAAASSTRRRPPAPRVCAAPGCGATRGLHRCGGCGTVRYCSEACSRAHWREHRAECRRLQAERAAGGKQQQQQQQQQ